jgi:hypothetical protein
MAVDVSWMLCAEEFHIKENGLCDAHDILFELHTEQVPVVGAVSIDVAAMLRSDGFESEPPITIRLAIVSEDGAMHPSNESWQITFTSPQVLWYKHVTDLYLHSFGFTRLELQVLDEGTWVTKNSFTILVIEGS